MYHLLVTAGGWHPNSDSLPSSRVFESTDPIATARFKPDGQLDERMVSTVPALFVPELGRAAEQVGRVGTILRARASGRVVNIEYAYDNQLPPIPMSTVERLAASLDIGDWELSRSHWAVKQVDLFGVLFRDHLQNGLAPRVFALNRFAPQPDLVSVMMPFSAEFDGVNEAIGRAAGSAGLRSQRADNIWQHDVLIQDIVSLIERSHVVVCDCTGRNPNVFYEAGIAHTLGRNVVLITQSESDIPFDLRHLRYIRYLDNSEGLGELTSRLADRLRTLAGKA